MGPATSGNGRAASGDRRLTSRISDAPTTCATQSGRTSRQTVTIGGSCGAARGTFSVDLPAAQSASGISRTSAASTAVFGFSCAGPMFFPTASGCVAVRRYSRAERIPEMLAARARERIARSIAYRNWHGATATSCALVIGSRAMAYAGSNTRCASLPSPIVNSPAGISTHSGSPCGRLQKRLPPILPSASAAAMRRRIAACGLMPRVSSVLAPPSKPLGAGCSSSSFDRARSSPSISPISRPEPASRTRSAGVWLTLINRIPARCKR